MDFLSGLVGAVIGGVFVLAGSWLQGNQQAKASENQFKHQRKLAAEEHSRRQVVIENERLRSKIDAQLAHGERVALAMGRFKATLPGGLRQDEATPYLEEALRRAGLDLNELSPYPGFLRQSEIADEELGSMIQSHGSLVLEFDALLTFADVQRNELPDFTKIGEVTELARLIDRRYRELQREGLPI